MKSPLIPVDWMGVAFGIAACLAATVLAMNGVNEASLRLALRVTARWSFVLFWVAYTGRAMTTLFGPAFAPLSRRSREFGLAYASAQFIHIGLVSWLIELTYRLPLSSRGSVFFGMGIVWTYLLVAFSFVRMRERLSPRGWLILRTAALNYILFAFAIDFVPKLIAPGTSNYNFWGLLNYLPFAAMSVVAPLLVLGAGAHHWWETRDSHLELQHAVD